MWKHHYTYLKVGSGSGLGHVCNSCTTVPHVRWKWSELSFLYSVFYRFRGLFLVFEACRRSAASHALHSLPSYHCAYETLLLDVGWCWGGMGQICLLTVGVGDEIHRNSSSLWLNQNLCAASQGFLSASMRAGKESLIPALEEPCTDGASFWFRNSWNKGVVILSSNFLEDQLSSVVCMVWWHFCMKPTAGHWGGA